MSCCRNISNFKIYRVKRGHLSSDYRQKCVNATRDILMSKARKMTILTITMFNENENGITDRWFGESDLASSSKGYTVYREVLGGIGGPNQANP